MRALEHAELPEGLRRACGQWAVHAGVRARLSLLRWHGFVRDAGRVRGTRREYLKAVASAHARRGVDKSPRCYAFICTVHTSRRLDTARARAASPPCAGAPPDVSHVCGRVCNRTSAGAAAGAPGPRHSHPCDSSWRALASPRPRAFGSTSRGATRCDGPQGGQRAATTQWITRHQSSSCGRSRIHVVALMSPKVRLFVATASSVKIAIASAK